MYMDAHVIPHRAMDQSDNKFNQYLAVIHIYECLIGVLLQSYDGIMQFVIFFTQKHIFKKYFYVCDYTLKVKYEYCQKDKGIIEFSDSGVAYL